jgi:hypothetical protein
LGLESHFWWLSDGFKWVSMAFEMGSDALFSWSWVVLGWRKISFRENPGRGGAPEGFSAGFCARSTIPITVEHECPGYFEGEICIRLVFIDLKV